MSYTPKAKHRYWFHATEVQDVYACDLCAQSMPAIDDDTVSADHDFDPNISCELCEAALRVGLREAGQ